jgi:hypothetical protein
MLHLNSLVHQRPGLEFQRIEARSRSMQQCQFNQGDLRSQPFNEMGVRLQVLVTNEMAEDVLASP